MEKNNTLKELQDYSTKYGGRCLSTIIISTDDLYDCECKYGHKFKLTIGSVRNMNFWCAECSYEEKRLGIDFANRLAKEKGGKCLSTEYFDFETPLDWECSEGHIFSVALPEIKFKTWCQRCVDKTENKKLPRKLYDIQKFLIDEYITCSKMCKDGRINSCLDEINIINSLVKKFKHDIYNPSIRMWYDILVKDVKYGWIPVNIKTTTMKTSDNSGNLAMLVYAYTDEKLDLKTQYNNGVMSKLLYSKLLNKNYNNDIFKDYFFLVVNKNNPEEIIINSILGLQTLTPNINNLPFQIQWNKNKIYCPTTVKNSVNNFISTFKKSAPSWKEQFLNNMRTL